MDPVSSVLKVACQTPAAKMVKQIESKVRASGGRPGRDAQPRSWGGRGREVGRRPSAARGKGTRRLGLGLREARAWTCLRQRSTYRWKGGEARGRPGGWALGAQLCPCPVRRASPPPPHGASCAPVLGKPQLAEEMESVLGSRQSLDTGRARRWRAG